MDDDGLALMLRSRPDDVAARYNATMAIESERHDRTSKGEQTRQRILECALAMFRQRGYDATTMRAIAAEAGVSLGNAYYYYASKEHLIHAYYERSHADHIEVVEPMLQQEQQLDRRLSEFLRLKIATSEPYHEFATQLFRTASSPDSPLSPFSEESRPVREQSTQLLARVVEGSEVNVKGKLGTALPELLWTYQMGIILYWIHDRSEGRARTYRLIELTSDMVVRLIKLSRWTPMRPIVARALRILDEFR